MTEEEILRIKKHIEIHARRERGAILITEVLRKAVDELEHKEMADKQLTKAKEHIRTLLECLKQDTNDPQTNYYVCQYMDKAEQFLKDCEVEQ